MNRKNFIESQGATCRNWQWSWSFINENEKVIIFGAWDLFTEGNTSLIFSEDWQAYSGGRKAPGYNQSRDISIIRLIRIYAPSDVILVALRSVLAESYGL